MILFFKEFFFHDEIVKKKKQKLHFLCDFEQLFFTNNNNLYSIVIRYNIYIVDHVYNFFRFFFSNKYFICNIYKANKFIVIEGKSILV